MRGPRTASEEAVESDIRVELGRIEQSLVEAVKALTAPVFTLFDFTEFTDAIYMDIVTNFANGGVV